jgi:hypothetical protein
VSSAIQGLVQKLRKPLLFALCGGLGSLFGALVGEAYVAVRAAVGEPGQEASAPQRDGPADKQKGQPESPRTDRVDTVFGTMALPPDVRKKIEQVIEKGEVEIGLYWENYNDLDLHCVGPDGEEIYFMRKTSKSGGSLDLDANVSAPYKNPAAEHIVWTEGKAPEGHYRVFVRYYANHGGSDPTKYKVGIKAPGLGGNKNFEGTLDRPEEEKQVYEFDILPRGSATASQPAPETATEAPSLSLSQFVSGAMLIGPYTAMIAVFLSIALVMGQNRYQRQPLLSVRQGAVAILGGSLAGLVAGVVTHSLYSLIAHGSILRIAGRLAGWTLLGAVLGQGMSFFIPNLPGKRAAVAGALGGFLGASALLILGAGGFGRIAGAAILGLCIGLMIALVEELAREAWLVVNWGPNEHMNISLGRQPVLIGSSVKAQIHLPSNREYPDEWAAISLEGGKIRFEDKTTGRKQDLRNGSELKIDRMTIQVRSAK